ncbi:KAT8 regulatory NSL complex subunit 1-like [Stegostoma tigrinum]|uniref:KAT8 regulatory NSL complex subunit 1-like n=1 Tax=Stegostoma tigrinum TaxID=3053191 RepID=UPI0028709712|nr:KAT8 regulatory NSL complex subunit 1-like [Stegostoma tigrinum]XP_059494611.1 KAT8 regulatory NSL complex subunit 1-like [Stegostoma tigrinum]XP_059494613.1 KAT8 regulatory NSL complex subunit 1-like [Stegostoma tigrinum]
MAAMAPALTEAATEAHHRFKLATPSSSLSPSGTTDRDNSNSLNNSKRKAFADDHSRDFRNNSRSEDHCKLVSPYRCLDAAPRPPPPPESVKLQGSFSKHAVIKSHTILSHSLLDTGVIRAELIDGQPALEFSPSLLKTMSASSNQPSLPSPPQPPVNGLAKKPAVNIRSDSDLNSAEIVGKAVSPGLPHIGSNQVEDLSKLALNSNTTTGQVAGEQNTSEELNPITEDLSKSGAIKHPKFGENGVVNPEPFFSTGGSRSAVSANSDECKSFASKPSPMNILDTEVHSRTLLAQSRQGEIERRACRLRKRLEVVQAKQVERHVQQQLGGFVEKTVHRLPSFDCLKRQDGSLRNQQLAFTCKTDSASRKGGENVSETLANFFKSSSVSKGIEKFVSSSDSKLRFSENAFDSDITESSSGGESDTEEELFTKVVMEQYQPPVWPHSEWRWAIERAAIVSRWNWLQAHVSDLEYRIRQQTDIYRQIRANKGSVVLGDSPASEDLSRLQVSSPESGASPPQTEVKASGAGVKLEMPVCSYSLPKILGKQVIPPIDLLESVTSCSTSTESVPTKPCSNLKPVNGVVNSVHSLLPDNSSTDSSDAEELLNKKQRLNMLTVPPDSTCIAARVRPLLTCKKRRLIRPNNIQPLTRKTQRPLAVRCNCDVTTSCIMCGSKNSESFENCYDVPMSERLALLDPCLHPVLSVSDDIPLSMHFQPVLKGHWQNKSLDKNKTSKKLSLKHKGLLTANLPDPSRRARQKLTNSVISSDKYAHNKNRTEKPFKQHFDDLLSVSKLESAPVQEKFLNKKRQRELSAELTEARQALSDMGSSYSSTVGSHNTAHSPLLRQLSASSESSAPTTTNTQSVATALQAARRKRTENSFDINNIVIPMSVAATTRVEKLQYKEILTPSWRVVDVKADFKNHRLREEDHEEMEDFSDAVFAARHAKYEEFERLRWTTWSASPVSAQRRGSRSLKSTDEHSTSQPGNTNPSTPQPASPDVSFHSIGDLPLTPSPCSPSAPPVSPDTFCSSLSRESAGRVSNEDTRCSTPDIGQEEQTVQPWEKRTFPLACIPGTERESRAETSHRQTRNSRRSSGSTSRGSREAESSALSSVHHDDKQRHSVPLRLTHR